MDERLRFVARLLEGEKMAPLCAEFEISRKTGYKIYDRYKDCGVGAHRGADRPAQARVSGLGRPEDPREAATAVPVGAPPRDQHGARRPRSARPGEATPSTASGGDGH